MTIQEAKDRVAAIAAQEVGYHEKASKQDLDDPAANAGNKDMTKYARDMDAIPGYYNGKKQGVAWCDLFHDWLFVQAFGADLGRRMLYQPEKSSGAGCTSSANYYKKAGAFYLEPEAGDQIFFNASSGSGYGHTGTVVQVTATTVETIEGNSSDGVNRRSYKKTSGKIGGYGRPNWQLAAEGSAGKVTEPTTTTTAIYAATVQAPNGGKVNLRTAPNDGADLVNRISSGTAAQVIVNLGEWCYITTAKGDGYMRREYVAIPTDQATQQPQEAAEQDLQEPVGGVLYARVIQARQLMAQAAGLMEQARELLSDAG